MSDISKIKVSGVLYDIKDSQAREDLDSLADKVEELEEHGIGKGWTDEQIDLLESIFGKLVYTDTEGGQIAAQLIRSLRGGVIPEEPITITFNGTSATISGLASLNTTFSGTTATIGG